MNRSSSLAPACEPQPRRPYVLDVVGHPASVMSVVAGLGAAFAFGSMVLAIAVVMLALSSSWISAGDPQVQLALERRRRRQRRARLRRRREHRLEKANIRFTRLEDLTGLVAEVEVACAEEVDRLELDALLDRYVEVTIAYERCKETLRAFDRDAIVHAAGQATSACLLGPGDDQGPSYRRALCDRQLACWDGYKRDSKRLHHELVAIAELIKLIAMRAAAPELSSDLKEIEGRLAQLDDHDLAMRQLEAEAGR